MSQFSFENFSASLVGIGARPDRGLFEQLQTLYSEPHRHYHDHSHVSECLAHVEVHRAHCANPAQAEAAIWFHDAIYDVRRGDNEEKSAELAQRELARLGAPVPTIDRVTEMILATKSHVSDHADTVLLIDIDLGILGASPQTFERYDQRIRKEYDWVPDEQYLVARAGTLQGFLERPRIYQTAPLFERLEAQARKNLKAKIVELEQQSRSVP